MCAWLWFLWTLITMFTYYRGKNVNVTQNSPLQNLLTVPVSLCISLFLVQSRLPELFVCYQAGKRKEKKVFKVFKNSQLSSICDSPRPDHKPTVMYKQHQCVCAHVLKKCMSTCVRARARACASKSIRVGTSVCACVGWACVELERTSKRARVRRKVKENWLSWRPLLLSPPLLWSLTALATCTAWPSLSQQKLLISKSSMWSQPSSLR